MLAGIRKRLARKQLDIKECELDEDKDDLFKFTPAANYIKISQGKIQLVHQNINTTTAATATATAAIATSTTNNIVNKITPTTPTAATAAISPTFTKLFTQLPPTATATAASPPLPSPSPPPPPSTSTSSSDATVQNGSGGSSITAVDVADSKKDKDILESRIIELEAAVLRLQEKVNNSLSQCGSPTFEKELREQLESMSRIMKSKERKQLQTCRDHKALQTRFARQENLLHNLQQENKALLLRVRQYEHCLDDVMRKVVDALVAEDNLREEVALLKSRVRDLEAQNAALTNSPVKGRDEGYCTMSSGQPQPSNSHLEDLPEEPEQWLLPAEPCSTEMEDWSMSQEELAVITLDEERDQQYKRQQQQQQQQQLLPTSIQQQQQQQPSQKLQCNGSEHDWIWNSNDLLNSTMVETDSVADNISQLLQQKIIYSEDEEVARTEFTNDFYKLVNIRSSSARSLYSYLEGDSDGEDEDDDEDDDTDDDDDEIDDDRDADDSKDGNNCNSLTPSHKRLRNKVLKSRLKQASPTPSEAGRAQVTSCSSSETDDLSQCITTAITNPDVLLQTVQEQQEIVSNEDCGDFNQHSDLEIEDVPYDHHQHQHQYKIVGSNKKSPVEMSGKHQRQISEQLLSEKECIEQIIRNELNRVPRHKLMKSQSTIENVTELRHHHQQHLRSPGDCGVNLKVFRSGSMNGNFVTNSKIMERSAKQKTPTNSWRRCNGWKRLNSPLHSPTHMVLPKKETQKTHDLLKSPAKITPTRIPSSCKATTPSSPNYQLKHTFPSNNHCLPATATAAAAVSRKSKIPPPVPVRRSYAS